MRDWDVIADNFHNILEKPFVYPKNLQPHVYKDDYVQMVYLKKLICFKLMTQEEKLERIEFFLKQRSVVVANTSFDPALNPQLPSNQACYFLSEIIKNPEAKVTLPTQDEWKTGKDAQLSFAYAQFRTVIKCHHLDEVIAMQKESSSLSTLEHVAISLQLLQRCYWKSYMKKMSREFSAIFSANGLLSENIATLLQKLPKEQWTDFCDAFQCLLDAQCIMQPYHLARLAVNKTISVDMDFFKRVIFRLSRAVINDASKAGLLFRHQAPEDFESIYQAYKSVIAFELSGSAELPEKIMAFFESNEPEHWHHLAQVCKPVLQSRVITFGWEKLQDFLKPFSHQFRARLKNVLLGSGALFCRDTNLFRESTCRAQSAPPALSEMKSRHFL